MSSISKRPINNLILQFIFPKSQRLKSRKWIDYLFAEGRVIREESFILRHGIVQPSTEHQPSETRYFGCAVPKKLIPRAIHRNRIKRLMREAYRLNQHLIEPTEHASQIWMLMYVSREMPKFDELEQKLKLIIKRFNEEEKQST